MLWEGRWQGVWKLDAPSPGPWPMQGGQQFTAMRRLASRNYQPRSMEEAGKNNNSLGSLWVTVRAGDARLMTLFRVMPKGTI